MAVLSDAQREAGWTIAKLGEAVDKIIDHRGRTPKKLGGDWSTTGHRVISALNIKKGVIDQNYHHMIDDEMYERWMPVKFSVGDVIVTSEAPMGEIARIRNSEEAKWVAGQRIFALKPNKNLIDSRYMYYSFLSAEVQYGLQSRSSGTTVVGIKQKELREVEIPLPPLEEQERIAGILGSLDDKIEANTRLIQTMEDYIHTMIKKISKSDSVKRVAIKDLAVHEKNQELPREHVDGVIHHYSLPAYDSGKTPGLEEVNSIKSNKFIIDKPCVLFSKLNPGTPRIWLVNPEEGVKSYASTEFIVLTPKENVDIANLWVACSEERISQNLADMASGTSTSHQRVRPTDILNSKILDLSNQSEICSITSYIEALRKENLQLAETRDALIKRLIG